MDAARERTALLPIAAAAPRTWWWSSTCRPGRGVDDAQPIIWLVTAGIALQVELPQEALAVQLLQHGVQASQLVVRDIKVREASEAAQAAPQAGERVVLRACVVVRVHASWRAG